MNIPLVMTVIGHDRPGLVGMLADVVASQGGNWLESRMCRLEGEFAGLLHIHVPDYHKASLIAKLKTLENQGLTIVIQSSLTPTPEARPPSAFVEIVGQDRPGIVRQISAALAQYGVNVEELHTECCSAPMTGETLFKASIELYIPKSCPINQLRAELEKIAADLMVDVTFALSDSQS